MKKWSELPAKTRDVWVEKMKLSDVIGREICITGFEVHDSRYKDRDGEMQQYISISFEMGGERHFTNTGSMLIRKQLEACQDELPIEAAIIKKDNWLSLS